MGHEAKRMPMDFDWPLNQTWWGYLLPAVPCQLCKGTGNRPTPGTRSCWGHTSSFCDVCEGEGSVIPKIEPPEWKPGREEAGIGWQMWQTTSEGSPISPVFATPEELARWLADMGANAGADTTATYEQWLAMTQPGSAPSADVDTDTGLI